MANGSVRRTARGELAEILGAGPDNVALDQDKLHRTYGFIQAAEAEFANAVAKITRIAGSLCSRRKRLCLIARSPNRRPPEFQILQLRLPSLDSAGFIPQSSRLFFEALSDTWRLDLMRQALPSLPVEKQDALLPEISPIDVLVVGKDAQAKPRRARSTGAVVSPLAPTRIKRSRTSNQIAAAALERIGLHTDALAASNNWVISGNRTVTGKPLLANDPHLRPRRLRSGTWST